MKIISQERNETLKRTEIKAELSGEGATPSRKDLQVKIAAKADSKPELTVIANIKTNFGSPEGVVTAYTYDSANDLTVAEAKYMAEKNKYEEAKPEPAPEPEPAKEEAPAAEEKPTEEAPEAEKEAEAPAEEKKEEAKE